MQQCAILAIRALRGGGVWSLTTLSVWGKTDGICLALGQKSAAGRVEKVFCKFAGADAKNSSKMNEYSILAVPLGRSRMRDSPGTLAEK